MTREEVDVKRLIATVTVLLCAFAATLAILQIEPAIALASVRLSDDRDALRSDAIAFESLPQLERERHILTKRYASETANEGAEFVRALSANARRHGVRVVTTSFKHDVGATPARVALADPDSVFFRSDRLTVTISGSYPAVLRTIADLSTGVQIVRVDPPDLVRDGESDDVLATIPVSILEPLGETP